MADNISLPETSREHCHRLRCKEMFIDTGEPFELKDSGSGIFWCAHTQTCVGPDGDLVLLDDCKPGRTCYEAP